MGIQDYFSQEGRITPGLGSTSVIWVTFISVSTTGIVIVCHAFNCFVIIPVFVVANSS